ncbi:MAG: hypothetical protein M1820_002371 [Bogoriella megaspora]|nr:MAG: hypothetical protein M1820_002371 [Bogoriella megaspora]
MSGLLSNALAEQNGEQNVELVNINEVKCTNFNSGPQVLGVRGLSACSVVAIVSPYAAIVAHIGPNVFGSFDPLSFIHLAQNKMDDVVQIYNNNWNFFLENVKTYVVCAMLHGNVQTAPEQVMIILESLKALGFSNAHLYYERAAETDINITTHLGTFFIDGRGPEPKAYVEDWDVTNAPVKSPFWQSVVNNAASQYQWTLDGMILTEQSNPPVHEPVWMGHIHGWMQWDGYQWT